MTPWPTDPKFRQFAALVADGVMFSGAPRLWHCCPLGAVCAMVNTHYWQTDGSPLHPTCDTSSETVAHKLGGKRFDWIDECRAFEVGYDGDDPKMECISKRDPFYRLGCEYRERLE